MSVFVEVVRTQVTTAMSGPVFLSWNGNSMQSGHITKTVQSVFKKAGVDVKITSRSFRKAAVTKVHIDKPEMSAKLAGLMAHNEAMAKKYYLLTEKAKTSVEVSRNLGRLMRTDDGAKDMTQSSASSTQDVGGAEGVKVESEKAKSESETSKKRIPWSGDDRAKVKKIFEGDMNNVTLDVVRHGVETHEELRGMSPRRIYDKLKKIFKKNCNALCGGEPPQECESLQDKLDRMGNAGKETEEVMIIDDQASTSIIAPTERTSTFNADEVATIHDLFKDMICKSTAISKKEVEKRCSSSRDGRALVQKLSALTLLNRIKYEQSKHRNGLENKRQ